MCIRDRNTGGGGGGAGQGGGGQTSGGGGSGIVIVRYTTNTVGNTSDRTTDTLTDSPTLYGHDFGNGGEVVGNYCTWNGVDSSTKYINSGGLSNTAGGGNYGIRGTIAVSSGLWYWEFSVDQTSSTNHHGVWSVAELPGTNYIGQTAGSWGMYDSNGNKRNNGSFVAYGTGFNNGDIGMVALDMNNGYIYWGKNGAWFNNGNPATLANPAFTNLSGYTVAPATQQYSAASYNFGQRPWAFTPPAGFLALTTKNLQRLTTGSAAANPTQHFDVALYTGTGASLAVTGLNFQPDLVIIKGRTYSGSDFCWFDSVRGASNLLLTDVNYAENTGYGGLTSFNSNGFTVDGLKTGSGISTYAYAAWCFKAGGTAVTNTNGTITSSVSANPTAGFSIVTYTGNGVSPATVGHGLGAVPAMVITKTRGAADDWRVWHQGLFQGIDSTGYILKLNLTQVAQYDSQRCTGGDVNTFRIIGNSVPYINGSGSTYVAYVWSQVPGYSSFGTWNNNNSTDGTFIYTGFKPAMIMLKNTDNVENWYIIDAKRPGYNVATGSLLTLSPNLNNTEPVASANTVAVDFVSNGFKIRTSNAGSGEISYGTRNYIYAAFAASPFGNTNGTAR